MMYLLGFMTWVCVNFRWYSEKFVKGQWQKEECVAEWENYRTCLSVCFFFYLVFALSFIASVVVVVWLPSELHCNSNCV